MVSGYIVKVICETIDCATCLADIHTTDFNAPILGLISQQDRGGLLYPNNNFIGAIAIIMHFIEEVIPFLKQSNGIVKELCQFIIPKLEKCTIWTCKINSHVQNLSSLICTKFIPIILKNMSKIVTDQVYAKKCNYALSRKYLKFT